MLNMDTGQILKSTFEKDLIIVTMQKDNQYFLLDRNKPFQEFPQYSLFMALLCF